MFVTLHKNHVIQTIEGKFYLVVLSGTNKSTLLRDPLYSRFSLLPISRSFGSVCEVSWMRLPAALDPCATCSVEERGYSEAYSRESKKLLSQISITRVTHQHEKSFTEITHRKSRTDADITASL